MDILCIKCSEPFDMDEIHERASELGMPATEASFYKVLHDFQARGCPALGGKHNEDGEPSPVAAMLYELLGDDIDGAAAMLEDYGD